MLSGTNLFLATSFAATPDFDNPDDVPPQFTGTQLAVPHPVDGVLYVKLRDDPATVQTLTLPVTPMQTGNIACCAGDWRRLRRQRLPTEGQDISKRKGSAAGAEASVCRALPRRDTARDAQFAWAGATI